MASGTKRPKRVKPFSIYTKIIGGRGTSLGVQRGKSKAHAQNCFRFNNRERLLKNFQITSPADLIAVPISWGEYDRQSGKTEKVVDSLEQQSPVPPIKKSGKPKRNMFTLPLFPDAQAIQSRS